MRGLPNAGKLRIRYEAAAVVDIDQQRNAKSMGEKFA
jgi:hypothetical protein